jgi:hypothetical protein
MCSLGLLVGIFIAAAPQEQPAGRPVVVRFKNGPVVTAYEVRPYLTSGFEVQERTENRFWNPSRDKVTNPKPAQQPKSKQSKTKPPVESRPSETRDKAGPKQNKKSPTDRGN